MEINFNKSEKGLVPAVIQDVETRKVLMLGYMNGEAYEETMRTGKVTFYSRSKERLWVKGEVSGNYFHLVSIKSDCDSDALLIQVRPEGPACHLGTDTCWNESNTPPEQFLPYLEEVIQKRLATSNAEDSYISGLASKGINKVAQKVGEEAVELILEAKDQDEKLFLNEAADLLFHFLILIQYKGYHLDDVIEVLKERHNKRKKED